jgi:hypothetical protein
MVEWRGEMERRNANKTLQLQPGERVEPSGNFFIFFARNPLKSPDSEKLLKVNESYFAFIFLHSLAFI